MVVVEPYPVHACPQRFQHLALELELLLLAGDCYDPTTVRFVACNPFCPGSVSYSTLAPSGSVL